MCGSQVVIIRTSEDMDDIWKELKKGNKALLWCDGLKSDSAPCRKRGRVADDEEDIDQLAATTKKSKEVKEDKVKDIIQELKDKHGSKYNQMQYRIWSEMLVNEVHGSVDDPPSTSMFSRAGGKVTPKKATSAQLLTDALITSIFISSCSCCYKYMYIIFPYRK